MRTENIRLLDLENNEVLNHTYNNLLEKAIDMLDRCYSYEIEPYNSNEVGSLLIDLKNAQHEIKKGRGAKWI